MAIGVDFPDSESDVPAATAFEFPANDGEGSSPLSAKLPRRLRRRLSAETKAPSTAEEINAKLREANLRRQAKARKQGDLRLRRSINRANKRHEPEELLSRSLARCWRQFVKSQKTTVALVKAYVKLGINERSVKSVAFEDLAMRIESATTLQTVKTLLERLEKRLILWKTSVKGTSGIENIDHLLKHVASQNRKSIDAKKGNRKKLSSPSREASGTPRHLPRYAARVFLCAYMIFGHPGAVFYGKGACEANLAKSAAYFVREFELLTKVILDGPGQHTSEPTGSATSSRLCFHLQLEAFDKAWCSYLHDFVVWKVEDSKLLEEELIRAACQLRDSIMQSSKLNPTYNSGYVHSIETEQKQVDEGLKLIRSRIEQMSGTAGIERLDNALDAMRPSNHKSGKSIKSYDHTSACDASQDSASAISDADRDSTESQRSNNTGPSLSGADPSSPRDMVSSTLARKDLNASSHENELLVNEIVHGHYDVADKFVGDDQQDDLKNRVRETMEKAFWDALIDTMKQDQPDFSWVLKLIQEVRDQLCELSPQSWRKEILETINFDTVSEELHSGVLNVINLNKILEFALSTLEKLSSPANDEEMRTAHSNLLMEIGEMSAADASNGGLALSIIKGLRFVLQQMQILKREVSKARIKMIEPLIKGPAGLEYLSKAFNERYGPPADASTTLPLTAQWVASTRPNAEPEWEEHLCLLRDLMASNDMVSQGLPSGTLRAGRAVSAAVRVISPASASSDKEQPECRGEKVDIVLRLGLLKLVSSVEGLKPDKLPETLKLNFSRLRAVQSQLQKIIVTSTSALVLRQILLSGNSLRATLDLEQVITDCIKQLCDLLECYDGVGVPEIVGTISGFLEHKLEPEKLHEASVMMANLLVKSLQAGDPIFAKVSRAVYLAVRGVVFGGSGVKGRQLAEAALRRIGASPLLGRVAGVAEVLITVAVVSRDVHGRWYEALLGV